MKKLLLLVLSIACCFGILGCDAQSAIQEKSCFEARIIEDHGTYFIVEPVEGSLELSSADRIEVPSKNIDSPLVPGVGSLIKVTYDGAIQETYPAKITNVYKIEILGESTVAIPSLENIGEYTEDQLTDLLRGLKDADLVAAWGEPHSSLSGLVGDVWNANESMMIVVYYKDNWIVESVKLSISNNDQSETNQPKVESTTYIYEKDGCGGDFTITLNNDGTFQYYEGMLSSYIGMGTWLIDENNIICLTDNAMGDRIRNNYFKMEDSVLLWIEEKSDNFLYVKVVDGERFVSAEY